jgi:hypothetical protein
MPRLVLAVASSVLLMVAAASSALAVGPQPLPEAACNAGTETAHGAIPEVSGPAHEEVAHLHTFDGVTACYHRNVTYPPR